MATKGRIIQVPVPEDLLRKLDELSVERGQSRAAVIREACTKYIATAAKEELIRQYIEGYTKFPEGEEEEAWAKVGEASLAEMYAEEDWSDMLSED